MTPSNVLTTIEHAKNKHVTTPRPTPAGRWDQLLRAVRVSINLFLPLGGLASGMVSLGISCLSLPLASLGSHPTKYFR